MRTVLYCIKKLTMTDNIPNISKRTLLVILFLVAFAVAFCSSYNPLIFRIMYVDSSVYVTIAQGITRGQLPYIDLADNKGPLLYLLSVPGLLMAGLTGIWITEILILFISVVFAYKTARFFGSQFQALLGTVFSFIALLAFFLVNAGTEEYALPFLMISFFIFTKYFFSGKPSADFIELLISGACFAVSILIRLNMFPLWAGFCFIIIMDLIIKRRFLLLCKYISGFCLGIIIIFIPVFIYLHVNGIFDSFKEQVIFAGTQRGLGGLDLKTLEKNFWIVLNRNNCYLPLLFAIFMSIINFKQKYFIYYSGYIISYFLMVLFLAFSGGGAHYNMVLIPFFIPFVTSLAAFIQRIFKEKNIKYAFIAMVFLFCCMYAEGFIRYTYYLTNNLFDNSGKNLKMAGKIIDENTKPGDKIISLGINGYIYPFTQRDPASRYFYQGSGLSQIRGAREEFINDILSSKPSAIVTVTEGGRSEILYDWHAPIMEMLDIEYHLLSDEYGFLIYIKND